MRGLRKTTVLVLLFTVVAAVPWFAGGVTPAGKLVLELAAFLAAAAAAFIRQPLDRRIFRATVLIGLIAVLGILQIVPAPSFLLEAVSPASARAYETTSAALDTVDAPAPSPRISLAPGATAEVALLALAFAAILFASAKFAGDLGDGWAIPFAVAALGQVILSEQSPGQMSGTFIVTNHYASFLNVCLAAVFAAGFGVARFARVTGFVTAALIGGAVVASGSRGGMVAAVVVVAVIILLRRVGPAAAFAAAAAGGILMVVASFALEDVRLDLWRRSLEAWKQFPIFGSGLGTFGEAYALSSPPSSMGINPFAHNDLLQAAVTGGVVGVILTLVCAAVLARFVAVRWAAERSTPLLAAAGAMAGLAVHGLVEFNFSIPAIAGAFFCLIGSAAPSQQNQPQRDSDRSKETE
jgi:O-antigen ligase